MPFFREALERFRKSDVTRLPTRSRQKSFQIEVVVRLVDMVARSLESP